MPDIHLLSFSSDGHLLNPQDLDKMIDTLQTSVPPVTDLWIFSHGWNVDSAEATNLYNQIWLPLLRQAISMLQPHQDYPPFFVGLSWPSKAWVDIAAEPTNAVSIFNQEKKGNFIEAYRPIMDPEQTHKANFDKDFGDLYDYLSEPQPTHEEIEKFVNILKDYRETDPHREHIEEDNVIDVMVGDIGRIVDWITTHEPMSAHEVWSVGKPTDSTIQNNTKRIGNNVLDPSKGGLLNFFRMFTFWTMKARAATIGINGLYPFLLKIQQAKPDLSIHLFGHSFGARLVSAAIYKATQVENKPKTPLVKTLILLLGAFSQFSFTNPTRIQKNTAGTYSSIVGSGIVANPLVVIYSQYDTANRVFYPLGMWVASPISRLPRLARLLPIPKALIKWDDTFQISDDRFGSIGADGAQGLHKMHYQFFPMHKKGKPYVWNGLSNEVYCVNVDGQQFIRKGQFPEGAHNDYNHLEIFLLAVSMSLR